MATTQTQPKPGELHDDLGPLTTKLARPRVPTAYVPRPRIDRELDAGTCGSLTLVCAGAGWGKTLAVASWATQSARTGEVAWLSLEDSENEPIRFWSCVLAALRTSRAVPATGPLAELVPGMGSEQRFLDRLVAGVAGLTEDAVLVLDDFQVIHEPACCPA